ncbi:helix-turn-helix domain-containing protein [Subsaxibacter sp. CAU 1640]|uniref:helix-turn-helix domain-containing protein n=1 Tax=Subsaxibacter sp. CAU 1640 TaxID=2933271 RepID=UPI002005FF76|nr:helix-turn-helix transcriptional regulator [Subsaxibacter sp. CAU 1640]MCK7591050.1 helix-turn-helix domain-containing protein [Subsaxibacter sp. CAU 1640]
MINNEEFAKRLEKVIEFYGETASSFSEKIGVQRSSISHILSGRNKPSLDFVLKVLSEYPEVELYWLLNGKGTFPSSALTSNASKSEQQKIERSDSNVERTLENLPKDDKSIERIVIFYKDGTFQNFENLK